MILAQTAGLVWQPGGILTPTNLPIAPVSLTVNNGDTLELDATVEALANANAVLSSQQGTASITVDPLTLTLPDGVTFDSGVTNFLSGSPTQPSPGGVPEPATVLLLGSGLLGLAGLRHRKRLRRRSQRNRGNPDSCVEGYQIPPT